MDWHVLISWLIITFMACDREGMSLKAIQELSHLQATSERNTHALTRASYFFLKYIFIKCYFDPVTGHLKHALESGCFTLKFIMVTVPWVGAAKSRILRLTSIPTPCFFSLTCHTISIFDLPQLCKSWIIFLMANYKIHTTLYLLKGTFWLSSLFGLLCRVYCPTPPPHGLWSARLLCPWDSPGKNTAGGVATPFSRGSSWPRDWSCVYYVLHWQVDSLPTEPPGRPFGLLSRV